MTIVDNLKDIKILRKLIELWLEEMGVDEFKIMSVKLCVDEAVYNGIMHAYKNGGRGKRTVDVTMFKDKNLIKIQVQDYGKKEWYKKYKNDDNKHSELAETTDTAKPHGRGIIIMEKLSKSFKIANADRSGTKVSMAIDLTGNKFIL